MVSVPRGSREPAIQVFRAAVGVDPERNHVQRAPSRTARSGFFPRPSAITRWVPPEIAILAASTLVRMPPLDSSEAGPPAMASISGVMRSTTGRCRASGSTFGGAV